MEVLLRKTPQRRGCHFDAVAGGIPDVQRSPSARPAYLALDSDAIRLEMCPPRLEIAVGDGERDVSWPTRPVQRDGRAAHRRRLIRGVAWIEDEHHSRTAAKEEVTSLDERDALEREHASVETVGGLEILGIE